MERLLSFGFLAPPTIFIALCLIGALLALRWRRLGIALALAASLCLFAAATPALSSYLLHRAEAGLPSAADFHQAQAIVVLGGGVRVGDGGDISDRLSSLSLQRVVLAALAYRRLHLPVAVSGGWVAGAHRSEASLMAAALETDFAVPVAWTDDRSRTTWGNAIDTAALLQPAGVKTVVLVSHRWHLPRAIWAFRRAGLTALPWPAPRAALRRGRAGDYLPSPGALIDSYHALHELLGRLYYRLRY